MDSEDPYKRGYLLTPPQGKLLKRSWQKKYYALYRASNLGVERVEVFNSEMMFTRHLSPQKLIPLNDCIKVVQAQVTQKNLSNVFEVICKNQIHQFSANSTQELTEWIAAFQTVAFGSQRRESHPILHLPTSTTTPQQSKDYDKLQEENMIYSSMSKPEIYTVQIVESEASKRCNLTGSYQFVVTPLHISISPINNSSKPSKPLFTWHYRHIRRFSQTKETFAFEAGRKCSSGEGIFTLETKEGNAIFQSVGVYLKSYKKQGTVTSSNTTSHSSSDQNDTGTTSTSSSTSSVSTSNISPDTQKILNSNPKLEQAEANNEESLYENTVLGASNLRPPISKPPRKNICTSPVSKVPITPDSATSLNESCLGISPPKAGAISDSVNPDLSFKSYKKCVVSTNNCELLYDVPEDRVDAWKTHGLENDNIHTEPIPVPDENGPLYASVDVTTLSITKVPTLKRFMSAPEFLLEAKVKPEKPLFRQTSMFGSQSQDGDSYDHLFGRQHVTNITDPNHIYKKLAPSAASKNLKMADLVNEGEEAAVLNDKDVIASGEGKCIEHVVQNNQVYSVVSKGSKKSG